MKLYHYLNSQFKKQRFRGTKNKEDRKNNLYLVKLDAGGYCLKRNLDGCEESSGMKYLYLLMFTHI
jgi:hypothetical protein